MTRDKSPDLASGVAGVSGARARRTDSRLTPAVSSLSLHPPSGSPTTAFRRRRHSSNFSDYSQDARDLLNPRAPAAHNGYDYDYDYESSGEALRHQQPTSSWDSLPLAFALLPALGGVLVQGGSSVVTDLMLLCLAGLFLHWSVTQPWRWYHATQQVREEHETSAAAADVAVVSDTDEEADDALSKASPGPAALEKVEEEATKDKGAEGGEHGEHDTNSNNAKKTDSKKQRDRRQQERRSVCARQDAALRELYRHEVLALLACFACPVLGALLLHALRDQLTRSSEGLISNFNLTIFIMGAEVRPLRHLLQLVQARTLHLQRIVNANPYRGSEDDDETAAYRVRRAQEEQEQNQTLSDLVCRLDRLEAAEAARLPAYSPIPPTSPTSPTRDIKEKKEREQLLRDVRAQLQPELDTLARALRRAHKQQALLENQVASRFQTTDRRINDALAMLTVRRQQQQQQQQWPSVTAVAWLYLVGSWAAVQWIFEAILALLLYVPRRLAQCAAAVVALPFTVVQRVLGTAAGPGELTGPRGQDASGKNGGSVKRPAIYVSQSQDLDDDRDYISRR